VAIECCDVEPLATVLFECPRSKRRNIGQRENVRQKPFGRLAISVPAPVLADKARPHIIGKIISVANASHGFDGLIGHIEMRVISTITIDREFVAISELTKVNDNVKPIIIGQYRGAEFHALYATVFLALEYRPIL
jgi:hypothetical protein